MKNATHTHNGEHPVREALHDIAGRAKAAVRPGPSLADALVQTPSDREALSRHLQSQMPDSWFPRSMRRDISTGEQ